MSAVTRPRILFVVDRPELNGGNKQIALFAGALAGEGFEAAVSAYGPRPPWMDHDGPYYDAETDALDRAGPVDLAVYTYVFSYRLRDRVRSLGEAHLCQGFEGFAPHLEPHAAEIDAFYRSIRGTVCVSEDLATLCRTRFGKDCSVVTPVVEDRFAPAERAPPGPVKQVLIPGIYEMPTKGVAMALEVAGRLATRHRLEIVRLSTFRQSEEERRRFPESRFLCDEPPAGVARTMQRMDLTLTLPTGEEGFGLPALESLASGVPVVCSATGAYRELLASGGARTATPATVAAFAELAAEILGSPRTWLDMRRRALAAAAGHRVPARRQAICEAFSRLLPARGPQTG